ncbi:carbamoyltransferase C-terminal domain-containing protein [Micromonospora sp. NPDC051141]|uniref:carbamoyltransferase C-terminal domain-containing protein n=1 Tax=Micromonospora sp. NPDC051141 TaxID=3364284 RepID=UPI0037A0B7B1
MTYIVGLNAGSAASHDPSACVVDERGRVLAFMEEERLSRVRHAPAQAPLLALDRCLDLAGITVDDVDAVAVGWDEPRMSERQGKPWGFTSAGEFLTGLGFRASALPDLQFVPHHRAHAESAFQASSFDSAAVLVVDGNGEDESISVFHARRGVPPTRVACWPRVHSLGYLYEETSKWLGLSRLDAGKTMGLAAYGRSRGIEPPDWIKLTPDDGLWSLVGNHPDWDYAEIRDFWRQEIRRFSGLDRCRTAVPDLARDDLAVRVAWAAQSVVERAIADLADLARRSTGERNLCIAGGVGLNCAANGRLPGPLFVPPVPHDAGVAVGAAWALARRPDREPLSPYSGDLPGHPSDVGQWQAHRTAADPDLVVGLLLQGKVGAVCRGRSEVGPRALCHRSILASPVPADMQDRVNAVKRRERWRPFGPVSNADTGLWKSAGDLERYMVGAAELTPEGAEVLPGVTHVDHTTRPQRLGPDDEPFVDAVLTGLGGAGHPSVLINTSFNGPGQPVVETADQALRCAATLGLDFLVLNDDLFISRQDTSRHAG